MAHLWIETGDQPAPAQPGEWHLVPLTGSELPLARIPPERERSGILVSGGGPAGRAEWHLVARAESGIRVNGMEIPGGIRVLADQDEIRVPGLGTLFFSTEQLAAVESLPELSSPVSCPRCRQGIEPGLSAVRCPSCGIWHHGSTELPCWTYAPGCAMCGHPTALDAGYRWTPEAL